MKVVITEAARADLDDIAQYIASDSPARALTFVGELLDRCEELRELPKSFPLIPRYESRGIRRRVYGNYLFFYRVRPERVEVIRILNGARDYEQLLFPDL